MSATCSEGARGDVRRNPVALRVADALSLAAAPVFAVMAFLTAAPAEGNLVCSAIQASPLGGMAPMYLMMSVFHAAPWLRRARARCA